MEGSKEDKTSSTGKYQYISKKDKNDVKYKCLDMKDPGVRDCIMDKDVETALESYKRCGRDYQ